MNTKELTAILRSKGISDTMYSLDGSLWPDRIVLYHNYSLWEVFYFDERGNRNSLKSFDNENDACKYILNIFIEEQQNQKSSENERNSIVNKNIVFTYSTRLCLVIYIVGIVLYFFVKMI